MIVDLPSTSTAAVSKHLIRLREDVGAMALGRVLTLVIVVDESEVDRAIDIANSASRQHPCRVIALVTANTRGRARLDAQIRLGGDAGASEVVVLRLYGPLTKQGRAVLMPLLLPDSPIVAWWPGESPAAPKADPIGSIAQRRITDAAHAKSPRRKLTALADAYAPGDTDLAWTRITLWRARLAAALDQAPYEPVAEGVVVGAGDSPSALLLAAWLQTRLRAPITLARSAKGSGIVSARLVRRSGPVDLVRPQGDSATLLQAGQPDRRIALPHRSDAECLADELRRLDADEVYAETLVKGVPRIAPPRRTGSAAAAAGDAPSVPQARRTARRLARTGAEQGSRAMESAAQPPDQADDAAVAQAVQDRLESAQPDSGAAGERG